MPSYLAIFDDLDNPLAVNIFQSHVIRFSGNHLRLPFQQSRTRNDSGSPKPLYRSVDNNIPRRDIQIQISDSRSSLHDGNPFDSECSTLLNEGRLGQRRPSLRRHTSTPGRSRDQAFRTSRKKPLLLVLPLSQWWLSGGSSARKRMRRALWFNASIRQNERWKRRRPPKLSSSSAPVQLLTVSSPTCK